MHKSPDQSLGLLLFSAVCGTFSSEPPRTRTWNLEIKSLGYRCLFERATPEDRVRCQESYSEKGAAWPNTTLQFTIVPPEKYMSLLNC